MKVNKVYAEEIAKVKGDKTASKKIWIFIGITIAVISAIMSIIDACNKPTEKEQLAVKAVIEAFYNGGDYRAVAEAREAADRLEAAGIRCRLEVLHEDKAFHRFGNGGMGTRMCVLVPPCEYERAKSVVNRQ